MAGNERYKGWPDIPTTAEQKFPSVNLMYWVGYAAAPGLPQNILQTWIDAVKAAVADPEILSKFEKMGIVPVFLGGEDFKKFVITEGKSIKELKLR